ncbi:MAG: hypothetical protein KGH75_00725 [Rhodospirillales bacterium]|nr:hypothetical protein [Rhodospirillales bacterium]
MGDELIVVSNKLPQVVGALHVTGKAQVKKAAMAIAQYAAANHPYQNQTGQAESGFYVVMQDMSTYGQGFIGGDGSAGSEMMPEVEAPTDDQTAYVSNASGHFIFLEMGTSRMPSFPSLLPAVEAVRQAFESGDGWEAALAALIGS